MKCTGCGSPLQVEEGEAYADCAYCGQSTRVRSARTLLAERGHPAKTAEPEAAPKQRAPRNRKGGRSAFAWMSSFLFVLGLVAAGGAVYLGRTGVDLSEWLAFGAGEQEPLPDTLVLDTTDAHSVDGVAEGTIPAAELVGSACDGGFLGDHPDVRIQTLSEGVVHFNAEGPGDLTLVVRTSAGAWLCDDDSGDGVLPRIVERLPVGIHEVWVGRFSSDAPEGFYLSVSEDKPGLPPPVASTEAKPQERARHRSRRRRRRHRTSMHSMAAPSAEMEAGMEAEAPTPMSASASEASTVMDSTVSPNPFVQDPPASMDTALGLLSVVTTPWSRVRVNGRVMGNTPRRNMVVAVGEVVVEVQREGQGRWVRLSAVVRAGRPFVLNHTFE